MGAKYDFTSITYEAEFSTGVWTDITEDVLACSVSYGIPNNDPVQRVASAGTMLLDLNNSDSNSGGLLGYYSPHNTNCRSGFGIGLAIRIKFIYDGETVYKFRGRIPSEGIKPAPGKYRGRRTQVTVGDWMYEASEHEMSVGVEESLRGDQALALIVADMPNAPANTSYSEGASVFPTVFDDYTGVRALTTMQKIAISEFGYVYVKRDGTDGETLVFEGRYDRKGSTLKSFDMSVCFLDYLTDESGNYITDEAGNRILIDAFYDADFEDGINTGEYNDKLINYTEIVVNPRETDTLNTIVLAKLNKKVFIDAGETQIIKIPFRDPDNKATNVSGTDFIDPPTSGTDYTFNTLEDGTGSDIVSDLSVSVDYASNYAIYTCENTGATGGYCYVQTRGRGVYSFDTATSISQDATSVTAYGKKALILNLPYQDDVYIGEALGDYVIDEFKTPKPDIEYIDIAANVSDKNMKAFMSCDIGDLVKVTEEVGGADTNYYINGVEFRVGGANIVSYRFYLVRAYTANVNWFILDESLLDGAKVLAP